MVFRFASGLTLVVLIALAGVALEKEVLELRRKISRQHYRTDVLREEYARLRLRSQELGAPPRVFEDLEAGRLPVRGPERASDNGPRRMPLLHWRRAVQ
jgi:hypothetical protein